MYHPGKKSVKDKTTNRMNSKTSAEDENQSHLCRTKKHKKVLEECVWYKGWHVNSYFFKDYYSCESGKIKHISQRVYVTM